MRKLFLLVIVFSLFSCSSERSGPADTGKSGGPATSASSIAQGAAVGQYSLGITPAEANRDSTLSVVPKGFNLYDAKYTWMVNGNPVGGENSYYFKTADTRKGDVVQATATVQGKEILSGQVTIGNTPPVISRIKLMPEVFKPGDTLYVDAEGSDVDGDEVTLSYEWTRNGEPICKSKGITCAVKRDDTVTVKVTPYDGQAYGQPITLIREIRNMPPAIVEDYRHTFDGRVFTCQIRANDPDGDPLTYSLKNAPAGMTINPSTGLVAWPVPADFSGTTSFVVSVSDGHGGEATQTCNFSASETGR